MQHQSAERFEVDGQTVRLPAFTCPWCDAGEAEQTVYKGTQSVVCGECGTPIFRSW